MDVGVESRVLQRRRHITSSRFQAFYYFGIALLSFFFYLLNVFVYACKTYVIVIIFSIQFYNPIISIKLKKAWKALMQTLCKLLFITFRHNYIPPKNYQFDIWLYTGLET
jgi:hypothetical protein